MNIRKVEEKVQFNVTKNSKNRQFNVKSPQKSNRIGDFTDKYLIRSLSKNRVQFNFENPKKIHRQISRKKIQDNVKKKTSHIYKQINKSS